MHHGKAGDYCTGNPADETVGDPHSTGFSKPPNRSGHVSVVYVQSRIPCTIL